MAIIQKARSSKVEARRGKFSFQLPASSFHLSLLLVFLLFCYSSIAFSASKQLDANLAKLRAHKGPYTFVVFGDNRSGDRIYKTLIDLALKRNPDFSVNTGDEITTPGNRDQWANFWRNSEEIKLPYFLTIGNHDVDDKKSEAVWKEEVDLPGNEIYYSWTVGKSLFVVLDTYEQGREYKIEGEQLVWLKNTLNPQKYDHQFVFMHAPMYLNEGSTHLGSSIDKYPDLRDRLQKLFEEKKVTIVFAGHEHSYQKRKVDGVWHIVTGGAGAKLYGKTFSHFVLIRVDGPRVEVKVVDKEGVLHDDFVIHTNP